MSTRNIDLGIWSETSFNTTACRYVKDNGRMVHPERVRAVVDSNIEAGESRLAAISAELEAAARSYTAGHTDHLDYVEAVRLWRDAMAHEVRAIHLGAAVCATGGFIQDDISLGGPVDQRINSLLRVQMVRLSNLAVEAAENADIVPATVGGEAAFGERVRALAEAARGSFEWMQYWTHREAGFKSLENDATLCTAPCDGPGGCAEQQALGRVAIDDVRFIVLGFRACGVACKCRVRYFWAGVDGGSTEEPG